MAAGREWVVGAGVRQGRGVLRSRIQTPQKQTHPAILRITTPRGLAVWAGGRCGSAARAGSSVLIPRRRRRIPAAARKPPLAPQTQNPWVEPGGAGLREAAFTPAWFAGLRVGQCQASSKPL